MRGAGGGYAPAVPAEAVFHRFDQRDGGDRFAQHAREIGGVDLVGGAGDHHDWELWEVRRDFAPDVEAAETWKAEVEYQRFWRGAIDLPERRDAIVRGDYLIPRDLQGAAVEGAERRIILDDENLRMYGGM